MVKSEHSSSVQGRFRTTGYVLSFAALCGMILTPGVAIAADEQANSSSESQAKSTQASNAALPDEKTETVYVYADAAGKADRVEVETVLKNPAGHDELADSTNLSIMPNDDVSYRTVGNELVFETDGDDVTYRASSNEQPPIGVNVTYTLDGNVVAPQDMLGKEGHVVVRYDFVNKSAQGADGTQVPFVTVTAVMVDSQNFKNITVENGKIIEDGDTVIVVGYALPGMQESLNVDMADVDFPGYFSFEADVEDFEIGSSLTIVTQDLLNDFDSNSLNTGDLRESRDELQSASNELTDASQQLSDGATALVDGGNALNDGAAQLAEGTDALQQNMPQLQEGTAALSQGAQALTGGLGELQKGAQALAEAASALNAGLGVINNGDAASGIPAFSGLSENVAALEEGANAIAAGMTELKSSVQALADAQRQIIAALSGDDFAAVAAVLQAAGSEVATNVEAVANIAMHAQSMGANVQTAGASVAQAQAQLEAIDLSAIDDPAVVQAIEQAKGNLQDAGTSLQAVQGDATAIGEAAGTIDVTNEQAALAALSSLDFSQITASMETVAQGLDAIAAALGSEGDKSTLIGGQIEIAGGLSALSAGLEQFGDALVQLGDVAAALNNGLATLVDSEKGIPALAAGAGSLSNGISELGTGIKEFGAGVDAVDEGAQALKQGSATLVEGLNAYAEGIAQFGDAIREFGDKGINELVNTIDNDVLGTIDKVDELSATGRAYDNFGGKIPGTKSSVRIVIEVAGITRD